MLAQNEHIKLQSKTHGVFCASRHSGAVQYDASEQLLRSPRALQRRLMLVTMELSDLLLELTSTYFVHTLPVVLRLVNDRLCDSV